MGIETSMQKALRMDREGRTGIVGVRLLLWLLAILGLAAMAGRVAGAQPASVSFQSGVPNPAANVGAVYSGVGGSQAIYYYVIARFPAGSGQPSAVATALNTQGPQNLSASNTVTVTWTGVTGATGYDVVRSSTQGFPATPCACAVILNTSGLSALDTGAALSNYPAAGVPTIQPVLATLSVDNVSQAIPYINVQLVNSSLRMALSPKSWTAGNCVQIGTDGNLVDAGTLCGSSAGAVTTGVPLTAGLPVIGAGGSAVAIGTRQGNTTQYVSRGVVVPGANECANWDASGNISSSGAPCATAASAPLTSTTFAGRGVCNASVEGQTAVYTDSILQSYCLSSAWVNIYLSRRLTLPSVAGTWINQGTSTISNTGGYAVMLPQQGSGGNNIRVQVFSLPATPFTVTLQYSTTGFMQGYDTCGLYLRQSSDGKLILLTAGAREGGSGNTVGYAVQKYTNPTTFSANYSTSPWYGQIGTYPPLSAVRISDNGTTRTYQVSYDAINWATLTTNGHTDFMTADQYGYGCDSHGSGNALVGLFYSLTVQ